MRPQPAFQLLPLGQSGVRLQCKGTTIYVDPYLSDSVEVTEGPRSRRLLPAPLSPAEASDADWILITHEHLDHFDPTTLAAMASETAHILVPPHLKEACEGLGFGPDRIHRAENGGPVELADGVSVVPVETAHPVDTDDGGPAGWSYGYILENGGRRVFFAGDTSLTEGLLRRLEPFTPVEVAFLPVNEQNFMRREAGIIGNMSIREAFHLARCIGAKFVVPQHFDMFTANRTFRDEIEAVHRGQDETFELLFAPEAV